MPLQLAANKDCKETWQSDSKPVLSKLETILGFTGIDNKDGCVVDKQVNKWLAKHALRFKVLNLTNLLQ
eukprot:6209186-Pleurochrysis_carterae.AAC.1